MIINDQIKFQIFEERKHDLKGLSEPLSCTCFGTSIWDETLYKVRILNRTVYKVYSIQVYNHYVYNIKGIFLQDFLSISLDKCGVVILERPFYEMKRGCNTRASLL